MKKFEKITGYSSNKFVFSVNEDIDRLNILIEDYNTAPTSTKKQILLEIYHYHNHILNKYSGDSIAMIDQCGPIIHEDMFNKIQQEFSVQGLSTLNQSSISSFEKSHVNVNSNKTVQTKFNQFLSNNKDGLNYFISSTNFKDDSEFKKWISTFIQSLSQENNPQQMYKGLLRLKELTRLYIAEAYIEPEQKTALRNLIKAINTKLDLVEKIKDVQIVTLNVDTNSFPDFLANMSPQKVMKLTRILAMGAQCDINDIKNLYDKNEPGGKEYHALLNTHSISFLGGGNSKNFKLTHIMSGVERVLKVENRGPSPKNIEVRLATHSLSNTLTAVYAERQTTFIDTNNNNVSRGLLITDFCPGGDLESHGQKLKNNATARIKSALNIYSQMGKILEDIRKDNAIFPDMKNSNWLINEKGHLKIADGKSFLPTKKDELDLSSLSSTNGNVWTTRFMNPPEFSTDSVYITDKVHAYMLGKNLYHYLTGCSASKLKDQHDGSSYDFSHAVFKTEEGKLLKKLIGELVKPNPMSRITVDKAIKTLALVEECLQKNELEKKCTDLLEQIIAIDGTFKNSDVESLTKIKLSMAANIVAMETIHQELKDTLKAVEYVFSNSKKDCMQLVETICSLDKTVQKNTCVDQIRKAKSLEQLNTLTALFKEKLKTAMIAKIPELKKECLNMIDTIYSLKADQQGKMELEKSKELVIKATDINQVISLHDQFEGNLKKILAEKLKLTSDCTQLIEKMKHCKITENDAVIEKITQDFLTRLGKADDIITLNTLKTELNNALKSMEPPEVIAIKKLINDYRNGAKEWFSVGKNAKAKRIENALQAVPLLLRDKIFSEEYDNKELIAVRAALASHRYLGNGNIVYYSKVDGKDVRVINETKAASSYKKMKQEFSELRDKYTIQKEIESPNDDPKPD